MRQKTWKRRLALALAAAMTLNTGMLTSFAKWEQRGDDWYFTDDETGEEAVGEVKKVQGKWYSFDHDGIMETDCLVELDGCIFYATPEGELAVNRWFHLDDEGHECTHDGGCDCKWYRFGEIIKESGKPFSGGMVKDQIKEVRGDWYSFDENGVMETNKLVEVDDAVFYITPGGEFAVNKWMFLDEDGHKCTHAGGCECKWYYFGNIKKESGSPLSGGMVKDTFKKIQGKWYSFDPLTGVMKSDELLEGISEERPWEIFYATENGDLFNGWIMLTADGHRAKDANDKVFWYFFKDPDKGRGMAQDDEVQNGGKWYVFDEEGHMISNTWYQPRESKHEYYYQYAGDKAVDKCLYLEETWYKFDSVGVATTSNAARKRVEKVEPKDKVATTEVGKEVTLKFQLTEPAEDKASTSDAMRNFTNDHDMWIKDGKIAGRFLRNKSSISSDGVCTITYVSDNVNEEGDTFSLCVDGVTSTEAVTVYTVLPKNESGNQMTEVELAVTTIAEKKKEEYQPGEDKEAVQQLTEIYNDEEKQAEFVDQWLEKPEQFDTLEEVYKESQRITVKEPTVAADLNEKLEGNVSVAGAAFNAPANSTVELKVEAPKDEDYSVSEKMNIAFDISLYIDDEATSEVLRMPVVVTIPVPKAFAGISMADLKAKLKIYNFHNGERINVSRTVKDGKVSFLTDRFSTYVFAIDETATTNRPSHSSGGSSSGGSSRSNSAIAGTVPGQWMQDEIGWWFLLSDGSYAVNSWQYVAYNGTARWYRFDEKGYICKGWFTDTDGHRYYLNPVSDGLMGAMLTGWQQIDGIWYYFNTVSDGTQGALLVNTTTPDGYKVDANGQWIQ